MKTLNIIITTLAIAMVLFASCSTKHLNTKKSRNTERQAEKTSIHSTQNETLSGSRIISIIDSASHLYRVNIFPLDTISFSMDDGFRGKASRIEVIGSVQQVRNLSDSTRVGLDKFKEMEYDNQSKVSRSSTDRSKVLDKRKSIWTAVVFLVVVLAGGYWGLRKR